MSSKRIIVTAGGTGGHIFPAISIAEELSSKGCSVLFVGNKNSYEEKIVKEHDIPFARINVQKLYRSLTWKHILFPGKLLKSFIISGAIIKKFKPDACIGLGGFVSAPIIFRAAASRKTVFLQEQNSVPGLTTRVLSTFAKNIFLGFADAALWLPKHKTVYTGNPLRRNVIESVDASAKIKNKDHISLLILGGSQGARFINEKIEEFLPLLFARSGGKTYNILWQCGANNYDKVIRMLNEKKWQPGNKPDIVKLNEAIDNSSVEEKDEFNTVKEADNNSNIDINKHHTVTLFAFANNMPQLYKKADIAVSRAGAISLAELEVNKIPVIIIPIPKSAGNHQYLNAKLQESAGKGIVLEQDKVNRKSLMRSLDRIVNDDYTATFTGSKHLTAAKEIASRIVGVSNKS